MVQKNWQLLLHTVLDTEATEITCLECFDLLDQYADLIIEGAEPGEIMPLVKQHLDCCNCCTHEFEALMVMLQEAVKNQPPKTSEVKEKER
jgi:hypothetical protein